MHMFNSYTYTYTHIYIYIYIHIRMHACSCFGSKHCVSSDASVAISLFTISCAAEDMSGVPEHTCYMTRGCVASINIGLPGEAVKGEQWNSCSTVLLDLFVEALTYSKDIIGLLVSGLGSVTDPYDDDDRERFDCLFEEAFRMAEEETDVSKHKGIQIFWARGKVAETVMIFKAHVKVTMVDSIILPNSWRRVEVARIEGTTEHNEQVSMLIYNTHQPSARKRH